jgi:hypothetical protein
MESGLNGTAAFPRGRAFVVKLHRDAHPGSGRLCGRIEHLDSGLRQDFVDGAGLLDALLRLAGAGEAAEPPSNHPPKP